MREVVTVIGVIGLYVSLTISSYCQQVCAASDHSSTSAVQASVVVGMPIISSFNMNSATHVGPLYNDAIGADSSTTRYAVKVFLAGPFKPQDSEMTRSLQQHIPLENPYSDTAKCLSNSQVTVATPTHSVDWVVVELRDPTAPDELLASTLGFLTFTGAIVSVAGNPWISFVKQQDVDSAYIVVRHRNHLAVMSATPVSHALGVVHNIDLTNADNLFASFADPAENNDGTAAMIPGDVQCSGIINARDRVLVRSQTGQLGYKSADTNMDGLVNALDRIAVLTRGFMSTQVP